VYSGVSPKVKSPVAGITPAVMGCIQAVEVIKYIIGLSSLLMDRLLIYDGLNGEVTRIIVKKASNCEHPRSLAGGG